MEQNPDAQLFHERIRQLAIEQMSQNVCSIVMTLLADGNVEVNVVKSLSEFGRPPRFRVDRVSKELIQTGE